MMKFQDKIKDMASKTLPSWLNCHKANLSLCTNSPESFYPQWSIVNSALAVALQLYFARPVDE
jgi:hypothetical protein